MQAVVGFIIGYLVGTSQGRQGLRDLLESAEAIRQSPEVRRLVAQGLSAGAAFVGPAVQNSRSTGGSIGALLADVVRQFAAPDRARSDSERAA